MTNERNNHFKYQLNINRDKFPELCQKLEYAKDRVGGIAWYLRSLVERDIRENGLYSFKFNEVSYEDEYTKPIITSECGSITESVIKTVKDTVEVVDESEDTVEVVDESEDTVEVVDESEDTVEVKSVTESNDQTEESNPVKKIKPINGIVM